jgi:hypothetical protein
MRKLLILLLFIPTLLYSQKLEEVNGNYKARVEYSVSDRSVDYIFDNVNSWIEEEFPQRKMEEVVIYPKSKRISGIVYNKKLSFHIEIICYDGSFIAKFSDFYINKRSLKDKKVDKVNQYLYGLSGRMQKNIRYRKNYTNP